MRKSTASLALLLAAVLLIGSLSGCSTTETTESTVATTTASIAATDPILNAPGALPVAKEKSTLKISLTQSPHLRSYAYGTNSLTTWLEDRTHVHMEFVFFPEQSAKNDVCAALSSNGNLGDLILLTGRDQLTKKELTLYGMSGALHDLAQPMRTYGANMLDLMDHYPGSWPAITASDGGIYALPHAGNIGLYPNAYAMRHWIHSDFLVRYLTDTGMGMPTTTEEYVDYLVWCRDNDPNDNGETDEIGWSGAEDRSVWYARPTDFLMNAFSYQNEDGYYQRNDILHAAFVEDGYREGLKYLHRLMEDGLMDPDYATNDENALKTLVALNEGYTVASGSWGGMHNAATDHGIRNLYQIVPPLTGPDGFRNAYYDQYAAGPEPGAVSLPANSDQLPLAMAWMDSNYDYEVYLRVRYGEKDVDWEVPDESLVANDGGPVLYRSNMFPYSVPVSRNWFMSNPSLWNQYGSEVTEPVPETTPDGSPIHNLEKSLYNASRLYEEAVIPCSVPDFFFDLDTATKADRWKLDIDDLYRTAVTEFIDGSRDIDDDAMWATYIAKLEEAGLVDYLDAMQSEYDRAWRGTMDPVYTKFPQRT